MTAVFYILVALGAFLALVMGIVMFFIVVVVIVALSEVFWDAIRGQQRTGAMCPRCGLFTVFGKKGERVCTSCGVHEKPWQ